jgi:hypothetical protein
MPAAGARGNNDNRSSSGSGSGGDGLRLYSALEAALDGISPSLKGQVLESLGREYGITISSIARKGMPALESALQEMLGGVLARKLVERVAASASCSQGPGGGFFQGFCSAVLAADPSITLVCLLDDAGRPVAEAASPRISSTGSESAKIRKSIGASQARSSSAQYLMSIVPAIAGETFDPGNQRDLMYTLSRYGNHHQVSIPISARANRYYLLVHAMHDVGNIDDLVTRRVLPFVEKNRDYFL